MYLAISAPRFHRPSAPLAAALDSVPGYTAHVHALDALAPALTAATKAQAEAQAVLDGISASLAETLTSVAPDNAARAIEDHGAKADEAGAAANRAAAHVAFLTAAETKLGQELDSIINACSDRVLRHLNRTLQEAYEESWALGLEGIHDAEDAISAGKAEAWQKMIELRAVVYQCRTAQSDIIGRLGSLENMQHLSTFGTLRDYANVDPMFLRRRNSARWGTEHLNAPWPIQGKDGRVDPADMHAHILDHPDSKPWIPTERELAAAVKEALQEARAAMQKEEATA